MSSFLSFTSFRVDISTHMLKADFGRTGSGPFSAQSPSTSDIYLQLRLLQRFGFHDTLLVLLSVAGLRPTEFCSTFLQSTIILLALVSFVWAVPFAQFEADLPRDVSYIAHDEETGYFLAFFSDGSLYRKFSAVETEREGLYARGTNATSCINLTVDQLKNLTGFAQLDNNVTALLGRGSRTIVTNPTDYPSQGAVFCSDTNVVPVAVTGEPDCRKAQVQESGQLANASGVARIVTSQGYINTASWAVQTSTAISVANTFQITLGIPFLAELMQETAVTTTFTTENSAVFYTRLDQTMSQETMLNAPVGSNCTLQVTTETCTVGGKAQTLITATGFAWYNFDSKVAAKTGGPQHYKWAFLIEQYIPNVLARSAAVDVNGSLNGTVTLNYVGFCQ